MRWKIACVVLLALGCSGVRADDAEDAAKWVESVGGKLTRDKKAPGEPIVGVGLAFNKKVTDDGLKNLKGLKALKSLDLFFNEQITDAGMKHVKELPALTTLALGNTSVSDAGVEELKDFKNLKTLRLAGCIRLTDKATETIKDFAGLEDLSLPSTITDKGVKAVAGLKKLKSLYLGGCTALTDAAVKDIADNLPDLVSLNLGALDGTKITDASVAQLSRLQKLRALDLTGAKITADGLKNLRANMPECKITK
jgi:hypothetical protein